MVRLCSCRSAENKTCRIGGFRFRLFDILMMVFIAPLVLSFVLWTGWALFPDRKINPPRAWFDKRNENMIVLYSCCLIFFVLEKDINKVQDTINDDGETCSTFVVVSLGKCVAIWCVTDSDIHFGNHDRTIIWSINAHQITQHITVDLANTVPTLTDASKGSVSTSSLLYL